MVEYLTENLMVEVSDEAKKFNDVETWKKGNKIYCNRNKQYIYIKCCL
jgi:hypothetical protein